MEKDGGIFEYGIKNYYAPFILKKTSRIVIIVFFICLLGFGIFGTTLTKRGLGVSEVINKTTKIK